MVQGPGIAGAGGGASAGKRRYSATAGLAMQASPPLSLLRMRAMPVAAGTLSLRDRRRMPAAALRSSLRARAARLAAVGRQAGVASARAGGCTSHCACSGRSSVQGGK